MAKKKGTSAFERGMKDGADSCTHPDGYHWYILGHKKRFKYHSEEFNKDYVKGFVVQATETVTQMKQRSTVDDQMKQVTYAVLMAFVIALALAVVTVVYRRSERSARNKSDTELEDSVGIDVNGVPCTFGTFHDQCANPG